MKVLFEIVHPVDVLFFKNAMTVLMARGDNVVIASRDKDIAINLLEDLGFKHHCLSSAGKGFFGLVWELLCRNIGLLKLVFKEKPDLMIGFGGVAISHVGVLTRIPAIAFYDSEGSVLQNKITWPFIKHLYVPNCYTGPVPRHRTTYHEGYKELSYLHPEYFAPDENKAVEAGYDPKKLNYFIRLVSWEANHDLGKSGWSEGMLRELIEILSQRGKVHISSERPLPEELKKFHAKNKVSEVHHLMAFCDAYVGESATMAAEAAALGVPSVFAAWNEVGYIKDLEKKHLVKHIAEPSVDSIMNALDGFTIDSCNSKQHKFDLTAYIIKVIDDWCSH